MGIQGVPLGVRVTISTRFTNASCNTPHNFFAKERTLYKDNGRWNNYVTTTIALFFFVCPLDSLWVQNVTGQTAFSKVRRPVREVAIEHLFGVKDRSEDNALDARREGPQFEFWCGQSGC